MTSLFSFKLDMQFASWEIEMSNFAYPGWAYHGIHVICPGMVSGDALRDGQESFSLVLDFCLLGWWHDALKKWTSAGQNVADNQWWHLNCFGQTLFPETLFLPSPFSLPLPLLFPLHPTICPRVSEDGSDPVVCHHRQASCNRLSCHK